ncbi:MAG: hypothetical protein HOP28_05130 [Gemmatimonadales bacterium]|nr:hypothetical protein [Gemmatimonadales bacterium]
MRTDEGAGARTPGGPVDRMDRLARLGRIDTDGYVLGAWLLGVLLVSGWYVLGHLGLARLVRRAVPLEGEWRPLLSRLAEESGVKGHVRLYRSPAIGSPVVWGARRPVILLPDDAESWPADRRRAVLAHELAHASRGDYLAQLVGCAVCAFYWFHPFVWVGLRRLRAEGERAADDQVLLHGLKAADYAAHLLEVARRSGELRSGGLVAIGMARRSHLEGRLLAILDEGRARQAVRYGRRLLGWVGLLVVVVPLAALRPVPRQQGPEGSAPRPKRGMTTTTTTSSTTRTLSSTREREGREVKSQIGGQGAATGDSTLDRIFQAPPGGELEIDLETGGDVMVTGWDRAQVEVRAHLSGRDWRGTEVSVEGTRRGARLHAWQNGKGQNIRTSHAFEIRVPESFDLRISSAGGPLALRDLRGTFTGHTGGGGFTVERVRGQMALSTGGGDILVSDSDLRGRVSTGGGTVKLSNARSGGLVGSSGSGPVIYSDGGAGNIGHVSVNGERISVGNGRGLDEGTAGLHISKAGGSIALDAAPNGATVHTGGGDITVGRSRGMVSATTGGGDIEIGPIAGSVRAGTGAGNIRVSVIDGAGGERSVDVTSGSGSLILELPTDISARFEIETAYTSNFGRRTKIDSDFELLQEETESWDRRLGTARKFVRASGQVGGGRSLIRVRIVNGDVVILRRPR